MKALALDLGDRWIGIAISDSLGITCRPYETVEAPELNNFLKELVTNKEEIDTIVVGYPKTLGGKESEQTKKIQLTAQQLELAFPTIKWVLWDERLSSKQAASLKQAKTKEEKKKLHAIAAALILSSYLEYRHIQSL